MRFILVLLMFTVSSVFAAEIPVRINDTASASESALPDIMQSYLSVTYKSSSFDSASKGIEKAAAVIKAHSSTCVFNSYRISPEYRFVNNSRSLEGYTAYMNSPCSFTDTVEFDAVLNDIHTVTKGKAEYTTATDQIRWVVSESLRASATDRLKLKIISEIGVRREAYSEALSKDCKTSVITYAGSAPADMPVSGRALSAAAETSAPDRKGEDVTVKADFTLICR